MDEEESTSWRRFCWKPAFSDSTENGVGIFFLGEEIFCKFVAELRFVHLVSVSNESRQLVSFLSVIRWKPSKPGTWDLTCGTFCWNGRVWWRRWHISFHFLCSPISLPFKTLPSLACTGNDGAHVYRYVSWIITWYYINTCADIYKYNRSIYHIKHEVKYTKRPHIVKYITRYNIAHASTVPQVLVYMTCEESSESPFKTFANYNKCPLSLRTLTFYFSLPYKRASIQKKPKMNVYR